MKKYIFLFFGALILLVFQGCKVESENIFNMFDDVEVTFHGDHPFSVSDYKLVEDGDSVYIDYTITSKAGEIFSVVQERVGVGNGNAPERFETFVDEEYRSSYSSTIKYKMQRDGKTSYRIYARNRLGHYIGDGYKKVTVEVAPSFMVFGTRRVFSPDSVTREQPSFFSLTTGEAFNFNDGQVNAGKIDFGIWRKVTTSTQGVEQVAYNYYSTAVEPNPFPIYDISSWEKRSTKFSAPVKSGTNIFLNDITSASVIEQFAISRALDVEATDYTVPADGLAPGNIVYFLTPEGRYGVFHVNQVTQDLDMNPFISITVKVQK